MRDNDVLIEVQARVLQPEAHVGVRREVDDRVRAFEHPCETFGISEKVELLHCESARVEGTREELPSTGRKVVDDRDVVAALGQPGDEIRPDEARSTGDDDLHG